MSEKKRIDRILDVIQETVQSEVAALLGSEFTLLDSSKELLGKEGVFGNLIGKQVCAQMDITGEVSGVGGLFVSIKDAIRLGGTLIMLPASELEEFIGREEYSEEIEDSYGEIANIIAGAFTKEFEEMYPKACRFVRKEQALVSPAKGDDDNEKPLEDQVYYVVSYKMALDAQELGSLAMLLPAEAFSLDITEVASETVQDTPPEPEAVKKPEISEDPAADTQTVAEPVDPPPVADEEIAPKFNYAKHKKRVDKLLQECRGRLQDEIGGLLGTEVTLTDLENEFMDKDEFFSDHTQGRQVVTDMEVVGDLEGKSYFVASLKDAIHLGGVLIMLPPNELDLVVEEQEFGEDVKDAYGEIANIASGVYTAIFEENYLQKLRFIRKELHEIQPLKVEAGSNVPIVDQRYYVSSFSLTVEGKPLGRVYKLFPAELLQLGGVDDTADSGETVKQESTLLKSQKRVEPEVEAVDKTATTQVSKPDLDAEKHKTKVDKLLKTCQEKMQEEVSALLGTEIKLNNIENSVVTKEEFFYEKVSSKQVLANMDVVGDVEGSSYLSVDLRDAVRIGGVLIMLPTSELESVVTNEEFGDDASDAYGEIANIIAGVYTAVFEEQYSKQLRFIKKDLLQVTPMKVDIGSEEPFADQYYYLSTMQLVIEGNELGKVNYLLPLDVIQLQGLVSASAEEFDSPGDQKPVSQAHQEQTSSTTQDTDSLPATERSSLDILLVGDDELEATKINAALASQGYSVKSLSFKDNLHNYMPGELKAVYLVMRDVNEQAFGTAIKISSTCSLPIVAAGPGWTRSKVIKAVKYGITDILLTPASEVDIKENVSNNLLKLAA